MDRQIEKKKWYQKQSVWITGGAFLALAILYYVFLTDHTKKLNVEADKLTIETVTKAIFPDYMATIGTVFPIRTIYLDAMEGGRVEELVLEEGAMVKKGDVILRLSNPNLNLSILTSEADLAEKTNFLRNTQIQMEQNKLELRRQIIDLTYKLYQLKRNYDNNKGFFDKGLISKDEYLASKEAYELNYETRQLLIERAKQDSIYRSVQLKQLEESLLRMRQNLKIIREKEENLTVKAPVNGQLGQLNAEIGEQKNQGQRLGLINDLSAYKIQAEIDEHYISRVNTGLMSDFEFNNKTYKLKVRKVYPEVKNGRFLIDLVFDGVMVENIKTGQTFRLKIELGAAKEAVQIPKGGFFQSTGGQWIFVVDQSGKFAVKRKIRIGNQNPTHYEVLEGIEPGEKVITSPYDTFGDAEKLILK